MKVWSLLSQKGGSGKTTLAIYLGVTAHLNGDVVSLIDLDPQRSAEQWSELRETRTRKDEPTVVHGTTNNLEKMLATARQTQTELVIIDTPPAVDRSMTYAAAAADLVIVPTRSDIFDELSLRETLEYLKRIGALPKTVVILNAPGKDASARADISKMVTKTYGARMLATVIEDQQELAAALRTGQGLVEVSPKRAAAKTIQKVYAELCAIQLKVAREMRKSA